MTGGRDNVIDFERPLPPPADASRGFDAFVRAQYDQLVRFLTRRTGVVQDAEDLAQESLARLLRYRGLDESEGLRPLLYRIAVNASHDHARRNGSGREGALVPIEDAVVADTAPTPEDHAQHVERRERLHVAILALPPKCQRVWLLRNVHGLRHAEIASRCGITVPMVKKHLAKALHQLQRQVALRDREPL